MKQVLIHQPTDEIYTIARDGSVRRFTVLENGDLVLEEGPKPEPVNRLPRPDVMDPDRTAVMQAPQRPVDASERTPAGGRTAQDVPVPEDVLRAYVALQLQASPSAGLTVRSPEVFRYKGTRLAVRYRADERAWIISWS